MTSSPLHAQLQLSEHFSEQSQPNFDEAMLSGAPYLHLFPGTHLPGDRVPGDRVQYVRDYRMSCWDGHVTSTEAVVEAAMQPLYAGPLPDLFRQHPEVLWDEYQILKAEMQYLATNIRRWKLSDNDSFECNLCRMRMPYPAFTGMLCFDCSEILVAPDNDSSSSLYPVGAVGDVSDHM